jgi:hypothetical protein
MATTTNFGWETPDDTDLVKDGALAIRTLGSAIDTSLVDLKGGTTGQVLSKTSNTDMDFTWVAQDDSNAIQNAIVDAKGDLITATAADTPARLAVGANNTVLTADSSTATGLKWATPSSGLTLIKSASFSNVADTGTTFDGVFTSSYDNYQIVIQGLYGANSADDPQIQFRYAGPTTQTTTYLFRYAETDGSVWAFGQGAGPQTNITMSSRIGAVAGYGSNYAVNLEQVLSSGSRPYMTWSGLNEDEKFVIGAGYQYTSRVYTGFLMKSSAGNIYGTVSVYGLAK